MRLHLYKQHEFILLDSENSYSWVGFLKILDRQHTHIHIYKLYRLLAQDVIGHRSCGC